MAYASAGREALLGADARRYERHRPEQTLLYQLVEQYYPAFVAALAAEGREVPGYVAREFEEYLRCEVCHRERLVAFSCKRRGFCPSCGARRMVESAALLVDDILPAVPIRQWVLSFPYALRFLFATRPAVMGEVLGIVYRVIAGHLVKKAGETQASARTGAVTLIQRFGSALNANIHYHMLFLDGVYVEARGRLRFRRVKAPERAELEALAQSLSERVGRHLEHRGLLERDAENGYLALEPEGEDALAPVLGSSITYRIALGPHQGRKAFTLRTLAPDRWAEEPSARVAQASGFSLHAGVLAEAGERAKLERLCRYIARPAVATQRLSLTAQGQVRYQLKTPYRDGTTHVVFEPVDFIARLAALVPKPRVNLTRYHGVFAPNSRVREQVTPARRGKRALPPPEKEPRTEAERRGSMTWAQRLRRVFHIDIETCGACGGPVRVIASIEDPAVIGKILAHVGEGQAPMPSVLVLRPEPRAPPGPEG